MIDPTRYGPLRDPAARTYGVAQIVSGPGGRWIPSVVGVRGVFFACVHEVDPHARPVLDYGVPWSEPGVALAAASNLAETMAG